MKCTVFVCSLELFIVDDRVFQSGTRRRTSKFRKGETRRIESLLMDLEAHCRSDGEFQVSEICRLAWSSCRVLALTLACAHKEGDEEEGENGEEARSDDLCMDDKTDETAHLEAAQLLQEFRSFGQVADAGCAAPGVVAAAEVTGAGADPLAKRERNRPLGSKSRAEAAADWEPKEFGVNITGGAGDIEPSKLDDMEAFLSEYCLAGIDIPAPNLTQIFEPDLNHMECFADICESEMNERGRSACWPVSLAAQTRFVLVGRFRGWPGGR